MDSKTKNIEMHIYALFDWLYLNRDKANEINRKNSAIRYILSMVPLGIIIILLHNYIDTGSISTLQIIMIIIISAIAALSQKIAFYISGAKLLLEIPAIKDEKENYWFKDIELILGKGSPLLENFYVQKSIRNSKKKRFHLFYLLKAIILISDLVVDERKK